MARTSSRGLYVLIAIAVLLLMSIEEFIGSRAVLGEERIEKLSELDTKQLDAFNDNSKLLTTLATALIGAVTGFLLQREKSKPLTSGDRRRAVGAWILAAMSLYFGHLTGRQVTWMLRSQFFNLFHDTVWWPARLQFWTFFIAAILLADFVYRSLDQGADA